MSNGDNAAALQNSGAAADEKFSDQPPDEPGQSCACQKKTWIEIELIGEDDEPVPKEKYAIELPDGTKKTGALDDKGKARVEQLDQGSCRISFPDIDQDAWEDF